VGMTLFSWILGQCSSSSKIIESISQFRGESSTRIYARPM
jgi:hypothetical protein